ncbi:uncharacterized protein LOC130447696 [Diorhabda sublineata]|uniref:uncharacterized protein LOC130447696 n=1 Tax=Diorhabda sublineata TaxID=1163346 RepID=UPI0024E04373|nr:uncharacterized protein LOC130447696 [Diorhabda sublineata]
MSFKTYKWCIVPQCSNTSSKTPGKLFIHVPRAIKERKQWIKRAGRDPESLSTSTSIYICEDHFDLPNDMENYIEYHLMGSVSRIKMKPGALPIKYECKPDKRKSTSTRPIATKRKKLKLIKSSEKKLPEPIIGYVIDSPSTSEEIIEMDLFGIISIDHNVDVNDEIEIVGLEFKEELPEFIKIDKLKYKLEIIEHGLKKELKTCEKIGDVKEKLKGFKELDNTKDKVKNDLKKEVSELIEISNVKKQIGIDEHELKEELKDCKEIVDVKYDVGIVKHELEEELNEIIEISNVKEEIKIEEHELKEEIDNVEDENNLT